MNKNTATNNFDSINLKLASPSKIEDWSYGEVTKPETINYRTQRSEKSGLFDEKIFGPDKDFECYCGKYRGIRYKGIVCEKCGVEITRSIVRRERMGHIELATPVSHIWFLRSMPSRIGLVMGMSTADLEKVIYFAGYIVTKVNEDERSSVLKDLDSEYKSKIKNLQDDKSKEAMKELLVSTKKEIESIQEGVVLDEVAYHNYSLKYATLFEARIGAEAIYETLKNVDLNKLLETLEHEFEKKTSVEKEKINKRISLIRSMIASGIRPEWMFLTKIPVIPPALRPMVPLDGGRYATSDVNDLYRRVINRNNRLKKLKEINAPDVILRNEKRILQEAVDSLIDNSIRHGSNSAGALNQSQRRPLKSISDNLKGKRGLFRANLLGKRVDYSGRSVIIVGPELKLHQCGLPKHMALELFKPFVISELLAKEHAYNIRGASRLIDEDIPEVWAILEEVIADKYVLLNRAPTLHRLGIQAFQPILIEGNAIQVHPLVCTAFNADFDGDQMAVHVPLSSQAQAEARNIMAADKNILKPGSGEPTVTGKLLDIILGCYWMTKIVENEKGEGKYFENPNAAITALNFGEVAIRAKINVLAPSDAKYGESAGNIFETTAGRILFNGVLPDDYPYINKELQRKDMGAMVNNMISVYGMDNIAPILDKIKTFGFTYATVSGITWGIDDIKEPEGKSEIIKKAKKEADAVMEQYDMGFLSKEERLRKNIEIWHGAKNEVEKLIPSTLDKNGSVYDMVYSGARGSLGQITQMAGMKGLIATTAGETIEFPILSSSREGLTPIEYFITTHGSRKGLTDTALNTAKAGYLTRRLFDVAQDAIITEEDCGAKDGIIIKKESASGMDSSIVKNIKGRVLAEDVAGTDGKTLFKKGHLLTKEEAETIENAGVAAVHVRSPLSCRTIHGICVKCYGHDLGKNQLVEIGEAVGTIAAQAIGEPGTQLTMRTFHTGGTASIGGDITQGLPRVEEVFEKRSPKNPAVVSRVDGVIMEIKDLGKEKVITILPEAGEKSKTKKKSEVEYIVNYKRVPLVKVGDKVNKGDIITDGSADIDEIFKFGGKEKTEKYIISEVSKLYELQGETVSRKHIEIIVRQMFSRRKIKEGGDTKLSDGDVTSLAYLIEENAEAKASGKDEAKADAVVMGITEISLTRRSFLSAASFQHTTRVLINAAIRGTDDKIVGLKENVIIGRLIPAGSGFKGSPKSMMVDEAARAFYSETGDENYTE
ncbi:MAG: DNA-directed RNA polymerase subunit beta' [Candidatus Taylorbacteria bacterium RIFCSPLOWO2_12_FULL_43_20]|uniref:DNA-directed RNA polymerase subunit beta' n=1 Tax=Candidatus Taylorbacteria bacterium RIFCSPLOWO2_12_FULL_43_20 TaxID=1802332 RepID=A0A1G2P2J5_9BACT|nr:MAG: DNA-directed RNA polymerase subunit beta' [Candidatus Taylorbacteria bacterium RIFCSPHIGHO2_01_FULL_43_120]OHA23519.1 MAG: DNA-directed RNA polymerase subunit beta' [Candidatus Taylorbacteria bacterium RIFCSPHIGHO2_02_FULL_43_55]OHA29967.1 MAG: DNA-directed RNA polymerase subunit beta' [Candidatus Taylorbacteria bacterium RIFCSPHIGHO2_12_FULL_42_34]OHA31666.1 MAG: DNA-directed RNA polymerase subunit beta' [Candidatus Taylorbacteria bacterium RIFCSPLOWO2_01_FULL_43_83]OHA39165.1 MAG: DNA